MLLYGRSTIIINAHRNNNKRLSEPRGGSFTSPLLYLAPAFFTLPSIYQISRLLLSWQRMAVFRFC